MKTLINLKSLVFIILIICFSQVCFSQNYSEDEDLDNETTITELNGEDVSPDFFNTFFDTNPNPKLNTVQGNSVFLRQIGDSNITFAAVKSNASEVNINQNGNENDVKLVYDVDKVVTDVNQNGNRNRVTDFVIKPGAEISLDVTQNGDNLKFERFGSNEISKNIKFTQTAASPTIIIRSFD